MNTEKDGGTAFPCSEQIGKEDRVDVDSRTVYPDVPIFKHHLGMTLRDYFAGQALSSLSPGYWEKTTDGAKWCYAYADAMLSERERTK